MFFQSRMVNSEKVEMEGFFFFGKYNCCDWILEKNGECLFYPQKHIITSMSKTNWSGICWTKVRSMLGRINHFMILSMNEFETLGSYMTQIRLIIIIIIIRLIVYYLFICLFVVQAKFMYQTLWTASYAFLLPFQKNEMHGSYPRPI